MMLEQRESRLLFLICFVEYAIHKKVYLWCALHLQDVLILTKTSLMIVAFTLLLIDVNLSYATTVNQSSKISSSNDDDSNPIKHIVIIMQENHTFDNYFGTYPGANGIPKNVCMPLDPGHPSHDGCVKPFRSTNLSPADMPHGYEPSKTAYNNGKMDGFMLAEGLTNNH